MPKQVRLFAYVVLVPFLHVGYKKYLHSTKTRLGFTEVCRFYVFWFRIGWGCGLAGLSVRLRAALHALLAELVLFMFVGFLLGLGSCWVGATLYHCCTTACICLC